MPCESTPRRLEATTEAAVMAALCGGTPAATRISSVNRVSSGADMRGMNPQVTVRAALARSGNFLTPTGVYSLCKAGRFLLV